MFGSPSVSSRSMTPSSSKRRGNKTSGFGRRTPAGARPLSFRGSQAHGTTVPMQILEETANHTLAVPPNSSAPVLVAEVLTLADNPNDVSVNLTDNGWIILVYGRRLVIWKFAQSQGARQSYFCRELTLPPSDLAHHASLVNIFSLAEGQTPSCIAVSPEGTIRFWQSIAHENSFSEISADLQGQECYSLKDIWPVGSVLATTTSTVSLIYLKSSLRSGKAGSQIACRTLKIPQGILGGIGRRVSSLLWGGMPSGNEMLVQVLGQNLGSDDEEKLVFVLTANSLQKWLIIKDEESDKMYYNCDVESLAKDAFANKVWAAENASSSWIKVWFLDMHFAPPHGLVILIAAIYPESKSKVIRFALAHLSVLSESPPVQFQKLDLVNETISYSSEELVPSMLHYNLLMYGSYYAYIFSATKILCYSGSDQAAHDAIDFSLSDDVILGAGTFGSVPHFFTATQGLVCLSPNNQPALDKTDISLNESISTADRAHSKLYESLNLSVSQSGMEYLTMSESKSDQLKAAFLLFCQRNIGQSSAIVDELFPTSASGVGSSPCQDKPYEVDTSMDTLVLNLSKDLIDDFPASDPRWMESVPSKEIANQSTQGFGPPGIGSSTSLLILHQLGDKQRALDFYIRFLKEVGLWKRLSCITLRDLSMPSNLVLSEHLEKIAAAISLRQIHTKYQGIVDMAIKRVLINREIQQDRALTPQDHFYRQISRIEDIFDGLQSVLEESFLSDPPQDVLQNVMAVNNIFITVIQDALECRKQNITELYPEPQRQQQQAIEIIPWTSTPGPKGLRTCFFKQFRSTLEKTFPLAEDSATKKELSVHMVSFVDVILDGYQMQLESVTGDRRRALIKAYEKDRSDCIMPLVKLKYYDEAASLAEKYYEFGALVTICQDLGDQNRLEMYMDKFAKENFSDFVFSWHMKEGKQGQLLAKTTDIRSKDLGKFLQGHSDISWVHNLQVGHYEEASNTLKILAENEFDMVARKKTILSIAKLSALAADQDDSHSDMVSRNICQIDDHLNVVSAQEQLPKEVLNKYEFDPEDMRVLTPKELIELYIDEDNTQADHIDFKKALELVEFVGSRDEDEKEYLKIHIWSNAILRDDWSTMNVDNPLEAIRETIFFKLIEFYYIQGLNLDQNLPEWDRLFESSEIEPLAKDPNFRFLIRSGYEHFLRLVAENEQNTEKNIHMDSSTPIACP